jgi:hypothetical protein
MSFDDVPSVAPRGCMPSRAVSLLPSMCSLQSSTFAYAQSIAKRWINATKAFKGASRLRKAVHCKSQPKT